MNAGVVRRNAMIGSASHAEKFTADTVPSTAEDVGKLAQKASTRMSRVRTDQEDSEQG